MENIMGKLHSLRRAIERDPDIWRPGSRGAWFDNHTKQWVPLSSWYNNGKCSYRNYIEKVLRDIETKRTFAVRWALSKHKRG
jgi:hypothetical protein